MSSIGENITSSFKSIGNVLQTQWNKRFGTQQTGGKRKSKKIGKKTQQRKRKSARKTQRKYKK